MRLPPGVIAINPERRLWIAFFDTDQGLLSIMVGGSTDQWDEALATAEPVLDSMEIEQQYTAHAACTDQHDGSVGGRLRPTHVRSASESGILALADLAGGHDEEDDHRAQSGPSRCRPRTSPPPRSRTRCGSRRRWRG